MFTSSTYPISENVHPQTAITPSLAKFFSKPAVGYTCNAIFVVIALVIIDGLYNATPTSLKPQLGTSDEPSVFSVAVEDSRLVNGIFAVCLPDARRHR